MKIEEALKETGKAIYPDQTDVYVEVRFDNGANYLVWVNTEDNEIDGRVAGEEGGKVAYEMHFKDNWQPYHEVKEIRPENAGELWCFESGDGTESYHHTQGSQFREGLELIGYAGPIDMKQVIHNHKNGWTREFPKVEDENVERIEIEAVRWERHEAFCTYPKSTLAMEPNGRFNEFIKRGPMKMILEIPKT